VFLRVDVCTFVAIRLGRFRGMTCFSSNEFPRFQAPAGIWRTPENRRQRGFTILELIVVTLVLALVAATGLRLWVGSQSSQDKLAQKFVLQAEARRATDILVKEIRESSEVVRPTLGETLPFLVVKDAVNRMAVYYLEEDVSHSISFQKPLFQLIGYCAPYGAGYRSENERRLIQGLRSLEFTCLSPGSIVLSGTVVNEKEEFQFLTHAALMNLGDIE
jgi:prepilin-type N-terminal cleavage/methylation domain-containing protein